MKNARHLRLCQTGILSIAFLIPLLAADSSGAEGDAPERASAASKSRSPQSDGAYGYRSGSSGAYPATVQPQPSDPTGTYSPTFGSGSYREPSGIVGGQVPVQEVPVQVTFAEAAKKPGDVRLVDDFDGQLKLDWQLLRPDPTHISLSKHPGSLTISTQKGTIHLRGKPKAKNILLLDNPYPKGPGFVVTTCLDGFYPREPYQQAGLIVYNDDDNYVKWVIEQTTRGGIPNRVAWNFLRETNGSSTMDKPDITHDMTKKVWLRLTLRKDRYEYASSTDGKEWTVHGEASWGNGSPDRIGLLAKAAWARETSSIDACFDFFEIRPLIATKTPDSAARGGQTLRSDMEVIGKGGQQPSSGETISPPSETTDMREGRSKLHGSWKIVQQVQNGKAVALEDGLHVVIDEETITVKCGDEVRERCNLQLRSNTDPKEIDWLGNGGLAGRGIYRLRGNTLEICMAHSGEKERPSRFLSVKGDGLCLLTLQRILVESERKSDDRTVVCYSFEEADLETVMSAIQEVLTKYPGVKIQSRPTAGRVFVVAPPDAHAVIRETLARLRQMLPEADEETTIRLYDGFDGKFALDWEPVRPDKAHVSLEKNPGKFTITTQQGGIYGSVGPSAKNFYLIQNPLAEGGDFVLTTCIESFKPTLSWQQAGLLVYDDDDNYLKCDVEWSKSAVQFRYIRETDGKPANVLDQSGVDQERVWIRITKRGKSYERAYSSDGKKFVSAGAGDWGDGSPKWIGIFAKNGPNVSDGIDAVFDFFELRSLTPAEKGRFSAAQAAVAPKTKPEEAAPGDVEKESGRIVSEPLVPLSPYSRSNWRLVDNFDNKEVMTWKPVRPDPTRVSLTKNPGKLTITTQCGSICDDETNRAAKTPAKNLYLQPSPPAGLDFAVTTCIESFNPTVPYQQAGLIVYDDDDNFVKGVFEHDLGGLVLNSAWETDQEVDYQRHRLPSIGKPPRFLKLLWLRIIKRGRHYEFSYSEDGEKFTVAGEGEWGNGSPKWIGLIATNGNVSNAADMPRSHRFPSTPIDAIFDSFEVRSLTVAERAAVIEKRTYSSRARALVSGSPQRLPEAYVSPSPESNPEMRLSIAGYVVVLQWVDGRIVVSEILASKEASEQIQIDLKPGDQITGLGQTGGGGVEDVAKMKSGEFVKRIRDIRSHSVLLAVTDSDGVNQRIVNIPRPQALSVENISF